MQFITHCGESYMVGINGMSTEGEGSSMDGLFGVAFGAEELRETVPNVSPCPKCGVPVTVESTEGKAVKP